MHEFKYLNDDLYCEAVQLKNVAANFGTPLYVYSKASITDHCRHIEKAFAGVDHLSCYAVKANANRKILEIIANEEIGADIGSGGELFLSLKAGFPSEKITFSGVGKREDEIEYALSEKIHSFNVESEEEIRLINDIARKMQGKASILLRINFDIEAGTHPYITTGSRHNKFGIEKSRAEDILLRAMSLSNISVRGIHSHIGSQILDKETFILAAKEIVEMVLKLKSKNIPINYINFGGGFGVQYQDFLTHPSLPTDNENPSVEFTTVRLLEAALPILKKSACKILIQPGRSIIAHTGILVTKVLYRKENEGKTFIITDAGMNDLIRPSLYKSYHQIVPLSVKNAVHEVVDIVGPLCESGDFFALDRKMPVVESGDFLAVLCTGAYGYVLTSNYNGRPKPAEILIDGERTEIIRKREQIFSLLND
jgi:diaminopimelate decarboxylase